jgi:hypothetical protein
LHRTIGEDTANALLKKYNISYQEIARSQNVTGELEKTAPQILLILANGAFSLGIIYVITIIFASYYKKSVRV